MINPHGGKLVDRVSDEKEAARAIEEFQEYHIIQINREDAQEINNISSGVFTPLEGFLARADFESVLSDGRLADDTPWTIPIVLDLAQTDLSGAKEGDVLGLTYNGKPTATLVVDDIFEFDKKEFSKKVFGTADAKHPGAEKVQNMRDSLIGGKVALIGDVGNPYREYTLSPKETRALFKERNWKTVVAFQTRNPPHLGHEYVQKTALSITDGLFINPLIGKKKSGDFRDDVILESYKVLMEHYYRPDHAAMSVLHTEMRYGGPKEAIHHAIMRKNFGCTHFIVGRDHAGVGDFYGPFDAHAIFDDYPDLEISPIFFRSFFFCKKCNSIANDKVCPHTGDDLVNFAGKRIRALLKDGHPPPVDVMRPEVAAKILSFEHPFVE